MSELVPTDRERRYRHEIPERHRHSLDTRIQWLWNQRSGTVQSVWENTPDALDRTAATMILQALFAKDMNSIALIFRRLEGGALPDDIILEEGLTI